MKKSANQVLTIVFTDVVQSSLAKRHVSLGHDDQERDRAYIETVQVPHFELIRQTYEAHGGSEVSTIGDSFYLTFENPVQAVRCAVSIQQQLAADPIDTPMGHLRLSTLLHTWRRRRPSGRSSFPHPHTNSCAT